MSENKKDEEKAEKTYFFGGIKEFSLDDVEKEVLNENVYLDVFAGSDGRYKEELAPIEGALSKVLSLSGLTYEWKRSEYPEKNFPQGREAGFIAQEVESVQPEAVRTDKDGFKSLNYSRLLPLTIESIKELSAIVNEQNKMIKELQEALNLKEGRKTFLSES